MSAVCRTSSGASARPFPVKAMPMLALMLSSLPDREKGGVEAADDDVGLSRAVEVFAQHDELVA